MSLLAQYAYFFLKTTAMILNGFHVFWACIIKEPIAF